MSGQENLPDGPADAGDDIEDELTCEAEGPRRTLILRSTAILPSLFTLANGLMGFGAIHFATKESVTASSASLWPLVLAVYLMFGAMVADMLDGRIARMTRQTTDFGAQLDSLCDAISFGVAPAILMIRATVTALNGGHLGWIPDEPLTERVLWCIGGVYVSCAVLRLARFNVENKPDASAHMGFRGLPSPGAAAMVGVLVLLFVHLHDSTGGVKSWYLAAAGIALPVGTFAAALLMVSPFRYVHVVNHYIHGRKPLGYLVRLVLVAAAAVLYLHATLAVVMVAYGLSGPVGALWRAARGKTKAA